MNLERVTPARRGQVYLAVYTNGTGRFTKAAAEMLQLKHGQRLSLFADRQKNKHYLSVGDEGDVEIKCYDGNTYTVQVGSLLRGAGITMGDRTIRLRLGEATIHKGDFLYELTKETLPPK